MGDQYNQEIGTRLRQIREHLGETQTVFAERFGLTRHDIANYERGRCDIPTRVLAELDQMGFNVSWVLNGRGEMFIGGVREALEFISMSMTQAYIKFP